MGIYKKGTITVRNTIVSDTEVQVEVHYAYTNSYAVVVWIPVPRTALPTKGSVNISEIKTYIKDSIGETGILDAYNNQQAVWLKKLQEKGLA